MKECAQCHACYEDDLSICPADGGALMITLPGSAHIDDKYRLEQLLARGSMGSVYRARQEELQRPVAIKVLNPQLLSSNIARERFRREALAIASLKHPNIVTVFDFGANQFGVFYIAMELLEGRTLADLLMEKSRLEVTEAVRITLEVCDALAQAHAGEIIHRDLKPSNIFLTESLAGPITKVIDFGLVKLKERADTFKSITAGALIGSLHYSAPEQCRSNDIDTRADIYSLGAILYRMITGQRPFDTSNKAQLIYQQLNSSPLPPHRIIFDIPPMLETAVMKAMEKEPAARYQTITEFATALKQSPKRSSRRTVGMFLSSPLARNREEAEKEFQQASTRALKFEHFVGRKRERAKLRLAFEQACEGRATALLITGDPGIGKTKLLSECAIELTEAGARCFSGQFTNVIPSPWSMTDLRDYLQQLAADPARLAATFDALAPAIEEAISTPQTNRKMPTAALFQMDEASRAERTMDLISKIFARLSEQQPIVIAFDDIHCADETSLNSLMYLISATSHSRILFLFSARAQEIARPESAVAHWLDRLASQRQLQRLSLGPLSSNDARKLIEQIFESIDIADEAIAKLLQATEGNPYYLTNVLRLIVEEGQVNWDGQQWHCGALEEIKIPPTVARLIEARLNFLSLASLKILGMATILGETFSFEALKRFTEMDEDELMRIIDDGLRYALLGEARVPDGGSTQDDYYHFAQRAIFQVLYDRWPSDERQQLHHKAAQLFTTTAIDGNTHSKRSIDAARQFLLAGEFTAAFCHQVDAANSAWRAGEVALARQHLQNARDTAERVAGIELLHQADEEIAAQAISLASHFCDYLMLSVDLKIGDAPAQAEQWLERALALAERINEPILVARALVATGHFFQHQGEYARALSYFERALKLYEQAGNKQRYNVLVEQIAALRAKIKPNRPTADIF
jgi:tetratricopeptide (TPR) repeat protein